MYVKYIHTYTVTAYIRTCIFFRSHTQISNISSLVSRKTCNCGIDHVIIPVNMLSLLIMVFVGDGFSSHALPDEQFKKHGCLKQGV